jgi:hypothetical protein
MKKWIIIVTLLALAPVANSTMLRFEVPQGTVLPNGQILMDFSESSFTVNIVGDVDGSSFNIGAITVSDGGSVPELGHIPGYYTIFTTLPSNGTLRDGTQHDIWLTGIKGSVPLAGNKLPTGDVVYTFTVNVENVSAGQVIRINDYAGSNPYQTAQNINTKFNSTVIDMAPLDIIFPEPMTFVLLGLGGLFLRRRK